MTSWLYIKSEAEIWTVGFYDPTGKFHPESDHLTPKDAAERVHYLNGGKKEPITRDAGATLLEVALFLCVFAIVMVSLPTLALIAQQAIQYFQTIGACIQALLECRNI